MGIRMECGSYDPCAAQEAATGRTTISYL
jgi:hypothetical protein